MGHDDDPPVDFGKALLGFPAKGSQNSFGNIFNIADAIADIFIINLVENLTDFFQGFFQGPFGVNLFFLDGPNGGIPEHAVLENHQMAIQDKGEIVDFLGHPVFEGLHLLFNHPKRLFKTGHLSVEMLRIDQVLVQNLDFASVHKVGFANDNTRIYSYAF